MLHNFDHIFVRNSCEEEPGTFKNALPTNGDIVLNPQYTPSVSADTKSESTSESTVGS